MAALAGASELGGALLTAAGLAYPIGPLAIIGTMAVASFTAHRGKGAFLATAGPELTLINLTAAAVLATAAPGAYSADRLLRLLIPRSPGAPRRSRRSRDGRIRCDAQRRQERTTRRWDSTPANRR